MDAAFRQEVAQARRQGKFYFAGLLSEDHIHKAFGPARWLWQGWIYTPAVTIWTLLAQCLSPDHSCRDAVAQLIACSPAGSARFELQKELDQPLGQLLQGNHRQRERKQRQGDLNCQPQNRSPIERHQAHRT